MNNNKLSKILTALSVIIGIIGMFFYIRVVSAGDDAIKSEVDLQNNIISPFIWATIIVLGITIISSLFASISSLVKNPKQLKKTFLSIAILGVLLVVSYLIHDGGEVLNAKGEVLSGGEKDAVANVWSSTGIRFSVILGAIGLLLVVSDMVKSMIKS